MHIYFYATHSGEHETHRNKIHLLLQVSIIPPESLDGVAYKSYAFLLNQPLKIPIAYHKKINANQQSIGTRTDSSSTIV